MIETMAGVKPKVDDAFVHLLDHIGGQALQPHQAAVVAEAALCRPDSGRRLNLRPDPPAGTAVATRRASTFDA